MSKSLFASGKKKSNDQSIDLGGVSIPLASSMTALTSSEMNLALPSGNVGSSSTGGTTSGGLPTPFLEEGEVESHHGDDSESLDDVMDVLPPWVMSSTHF
jgi:hypothetical protein